jgi:hypothetical protein
MGEATTGALKDPALLQNLRDTVALQSFAWCFFPSVRNKSVAVECSHSRGDALLQTEQKNSASVSRYVRRNGQGHCKVFIKT